MSSNLILLNSGLDIIFKPEGYSPLIREEECVRYLRTSLSLRNIQYQISLLFLYSKFNNVPHPASGQHQSNSANLLCLYSHCRPNARDCLECLEVLRGVG